MFFCVWLLSSRALVLKHTCVLLCSFSSVTLVTGDGFPALRSDTVCLRVTVAGSLDCLQGEAVMDNAAVGSCSRPPGMWHACFREHTQAHDTDVRV